MPRRTKQAMASESTGSVGRAAQDFDLAIGGCEEEDELPIDADLTDQFVKKPTTPRKGASTTVLDDGDGEKNVASDGDEGSGESDEDGGGDGDWLSFYTAKLTLRAVLVGKSKGRTIRAMKVRVDKLCESKDTRTMGLTPTSTTKK